MYTLGIILARAGSKGLPRKCILPVRGRPMIEHTFDHALQSRRLSHIVLTTDSQPAARLARARGIAVVERPPELATDSATVDAAARHAVECVEKVLKRRVDAAALLYANIPVRVADSLDRAIEKLERTGASSVRSVAPVGKLHPDWMHRLDGDRMVQFRQNSIYRRQDLEPLYYHDGAVVVVTRQALFAAADRPEDAQAFLGTDRRALVQAPEDAVDVDTLIDLRVAEALLGAAVVREPA